MIEKWYYSMMLRGIGKKPGINSNAYLLRKLLWLNSAIALILMVLSKAEQRGIILLFLCLQFFFLQLIYLWVKYEVGYHMFWIQKGANPFLYWLNLAMLYIVYGVSSFFPFWVVQI